MNTGKRTRITGGEVAAEVEVEVIVINTVGRKERAVVGAEAAVQVLIITRIAGEADMMMNGSGVVAVGHLEVPLLPSVAPVLEEARLHVEHHPPGKKVLLDASEMNVHLHRKVSHPVVDLLILEAHLHIILMLMNDGEWLDILRNLWLM